MNKRPTPETDAEVNELVTSNTYNMVTASFARRLERERDEARDTAEKAKIERIKATLRFWRKEEA